MKGLSAEDKYNFVLSKSLEICVRHVPKRRSSKRKQAIPRDRRVLMRKRRKMQQKIIRRGRANNVASMRDKICRIESRLKASLEMERAAEEQRAVEVVKTNPKYFFQYAKRKSTVTTRIGPLESEDGILVQEPEQMAVVLQKQYEKVFSVPNPSSNSHTPCQASAAGDNGAELLDVIEFGRADFVRVAARLRSTAAAGPDGVPAVLLKNCIEELSCPLVALWETSLRSGEIPAALKTARVTPIFKGGSKSSPSSYRPVALTSHIIKLFERILADKIVDFLEEKSLLNENQHGFRRGRSCLSQLLDHHDRLLDALERSAGVDVIYLDLWKAFDQVDHGIVLHKARAMGIGGRVLSWLQAFLSGRTQAVVVEGCSSGDSDVRSGVPQGSVLGPVLFLLLLGDIDATIINSFASSFADDTKLMGKVNGISCISKIQKDLENVYRWADDNNMKFNSNKFQLLRYQSHVQDRQLPSYIAYDSTEIVECQVVKDLGVLMANDLSFSHQIHEMVNSARKQMGWILRTFASRDTELMMTLFRSLVLPRLEYCSLL